MSVYLSISCSSSSFFLSLIHRHKIDFSYFLLFHMSTRVHLTRMTATQTTSIIWPVSGILQYEKTTTMRSTIHHISVSTTRIHAHTELCSHQSVSDEDVDLITSFVLGRTFFTYNDVLPSFLGFFSPSLSLLMLHHLLLQRPFLNMKEMSKYLWTMKWNRWIPVCVCVWKRERENNFPLVCFKVSYLFISRSLKHQINYKHNLYK